MHLTASLLCLLCVSALQQPNPARIPAGRGELLLQVGGHDIRTFTYRSKNYAAKQGPLILVFHGSARNAEDYRDYAAALAENCGGLAVAPCFDRRQFSEADYDYGKVMSAGRLMPREQWTFTLASKLIDTVRRMERRGDMPYYLIGHSAGGQFVERLLVFADVKPLRAVAANPGSHLFPTRDIPFPYGFGGLPASLASDEVLKAYLAMPLVIYVGTSDTKTDGKSVDASRTAEREGRNRLSRGHHCFNMAQRLARAKGWPFHWRLVEASGVGHSACRMLTRPECQTVLFGR
jgi:dienelactone hydrolase